MSNGPLTRYAKLRVAHAPGMSGTFSPPSTSKEKLVRVPGMHHGTCVTHVPWCTSGSLTRGDGENVSGIPGACATRSFTYLARGPWWFYKSGPSTRLGFLLWGQGIPRTIAIPFSPHFINVTGMKQCTFHWLIYSELVQKQMVWLFTI